MIAHAVAFGSSIRFVLNADWVWAILAATVVYLLLAHRAGAWPRHRTVAFLSGMATLAVAFVSPLDNYDVVSLLAHTTQHLLIAFVAAPLIALSSPLTLLREALPASARTAATNAMRTRAARSLASPAFLWSVFVIGVIATHEPGAFRLALVDGKVHDLQHAVYLLGGVLFWLPVVGGDPPLRALRRPASVAYVGAAATLFMVLDLAVLARSTSVYRYYSSLPSPWGRHAALVAQHRTALVVLVSLAAVVLITDLSARLATRRP